MLLCDLSNVLVLSEPVCSYLTMGRVRIPPTALGVKGGFSDIMQVKWLAQGMLDEHISSCY